MRLSSDDMMQSVKYTSLKFRKEVWCGDINVGVDRALLSKSMNLNEVTNEVCVGREKEPRVSHEAPNIEKGGRTSKIGLEGAASEAGRKLRKNSVLETKNEKLPRSKE